MAQSLQDSCVGGTFRHEQAARQAEHLEEARRGETGQLPADDDPTIVAAHPQLAPAAVQPTRQPVA